MKHITTSTLYNIYADYFISHYGGFSLQKVAKMLHNLNRLVLA